MRRLLRDQADLIAGAPLHRALSLIASTSSGKVIDPPVTSAEWRESCATLQDGGFPEPDSAMQWISAQVQKYPCKLCPVRPAGPSSREGFLFVAMYGQ